MVAVGRAAAGRVVVVREEATAVAGTELVARAAAARASGEVARASVEVAGVSAEVARASAEVARASVQVVREASEDTEEVLALAREHSPLQCL